jgi:predicted alpha/beta hydrolase family esterase
LKYANYKKVNLKGLITVAGFNNFLSGDIDFDKINSEFYQDSENLILSGKYFSFIHSFYSDNDPYIPIDVLEEFTSFINSTKHLIKDGGHINKSSGFTSFPQLIELLTDKTK